MRRREFIAFLGGALGAYAAEVRAQPMGRIRRVGVLMALAADDPETQARVKAFAQALEQLGWKDPSQIHVEYRWPGGDLRRIQSYAAELVSLAPDVILANASPALVALLRETRTIPIVFVQIIDPVSRGFVKSLARPGGNVTGFTNFEFPMGSKWVEMVKVVAPSTKSLAVIFNPDTAPYGDSFFQQMKTSSALPEISAFDLRVHNANELESAIVAVVDKPAVGLIVLPDTFTSVNRDVIIALASRYQLPAVYPFRYFATRGGLMSYGVDALELFRRSAGYVDRILRGENPGNLPVEAPTKYELVINLKTAKMLGLSVPQTLLATADEILE